MKALIAFLFMHAVLCMAAAPPRILSTRLLTAQPLEYEKTEFSIDISASFTNPYVPCDIAVDMHLTAPSGREFSLPCFFGSGDTLGSHWLARFAPQETGRYLYFFTAEDHTHSSVSSDTLEFSAFPSTRNGFLHTHGYWCLSFDSGKPFRGLGENVGWESRSFEDSLWSYDSLLPSLARNGATFFRTWMCQWNLPLEWQTVRATKRYNDTKEYYNPGGIRRLDRLVTLADSLGLYIMLTLDTGSSPSNPFWYDSSLYHGSNVNPAEFFRSAAIRQKYKDKLRYIVARWGYSTSIGAFEFFNELDNMAFTASPHDSVIIPHEAITEWHSEMSRYLHNTDPYHHIITTSISHRDIIGLDALPYIDINQKHIYNHTNALQSELERYSRAYNKPYVIGEFGYEWNWNIDFSTITTGLEYDYRRGLWYGLFSPTPILPLTWWWEFFDAHGMTAYLRSVREISDRMLKAGNGSFNKIEVKSTTIESYGLQCGETLFIYLLNNSNSDVTSDLTIGSAGRGPYAVLSFEPAGRIYKALGTSKRIRNGVSVPTRIHMKSKHELILVLTPAQRGA